MWVEDDLTIPDRSEVYVVGDLIARTQEGKQLPAVAPLAMQSGRQVARNIQLAIEGKAGEPFVYIDKGAMATIGRNRAVAQIGRFRFSGIFAWWLWLLVHVMSLVDYKRRALVLVEWAWAYFTWQRRSRVILEVPREIAPDRPSIQGRRLFSAPAPTKLKRSGTR